MLCSKCGASNRDDENFCRSCLQPLTGGVWQPPKSDVLSSAGVLEDGGYAGFWERLAALFLDGIVLWIISMVVNFGLGLALGIAAGASGGGMSPAIMLVFSVSPLLIAAIYFVSMESGERGATFGKRWLKLRVVNTGGERIGVGRALLRYVAHALSDITLLIGYLIQPFTGKKQALHDMVSGTMVVKTEKTSNTVAIVIAVVALFFVMIAVVGILAAVAIPAYQDYVTKAKTAQAVQIGNMAAKAVESYYVQTGKVPASIAETKAQLPMPNFISDITVDPTSGKVQVVFASNLGAAIGGKALSFDASQSADGHIVWKCSGNGIPPKLLPQNCR